MSPEPPELTVSRRTPPWSTHFNNADNIERYLQEDGHRTWGLVIYRCTYESDDDWDQVLDINLKGTFNTLREAGKQLRTTSSIP